MPNYTTNLNLEKPLASEQYNVEVWNANSDKIDTFAGQVPPRALTADKLTTGAKINNTLFKGDTDITLPVATNSVAGTVKPDNNTIVVDGNGVISTTHSELHALKSYSDEGEQLTDSEGLADVVKYAYSKFDSSKFTDNASTTVTTNGIASGFSNTNYLTFDCKVDFYNTFDLYLGEYTISDFAHFQWFYKNTGIMIKFDTNKKLYLYLSSDGNNWDIASGQNGDTLFVVGQKVRVRVTFDGSKYTLYSSINGGEWHSEKEVTSSTKVLFAQTTMVGSDGTANCFTGSADLKQIKLLFNGDTLFSGCETGVDTIKLKAYTKGGSPNDVDGVVSGFSNTNTITSDFDFYPTGTWTIEGSFVTPTTAITDTWATLVWNMFGFGIKIAIYQDLKIGFKASSNNSSFDIANDIKGTTTLVAGAKYFFRLEFTGTAYNLYIKNSPTTSWYLEATVPSTTAIYTTANTKLRIGASSGGAQPFNGTIDMNDLKIYYDDVLVYQGCLLIPYTQSSTGSKVVDTYHQSRLIGMYEQFGYAPYYQLNKGNTQFALPMSELYGLILNSGNTFGKPDYLSGVAIAVAENTTYTAPYNGWISMQCENFAAYAVNVSASVNGLVNGVNAARFASTYADNASNAILLWIPVTKGDNFSYFTQNLNALAIITKTFYKNKGV